MEALKHPSAVAGRVDEREAVEAAARRVHDARDAPVRDGVVGVERREDDGAIDAGPRRALEVPREVRLRVPRTGQTVSDTGVTVTVDDHLCAADARSGPAGPGRGASELARFLLRLE